MRNYSAPLTAKQQAVLDFIREHLAEKGFPPTRDEISTHFGWTSWNAAQVHVQAIKRKGYIKVARGVSRGIRIVDQGERLTSSSPKGLGLPEQGLHVRSRD